jgi:seryl-tRNA synthetase
MEVTVGLLTEHSKKSPVLMAFVLGLHQDDDGSVRVPNLLRATWRRGSACS